MSLLDYTSYERIKDKVLAFYDSRGKKFEPIDAFLLWATIKLIPKIVFILFSYWLLQLIFIKFMYPHYGFEKTIIYLGIIFLIRPMLQDILKATLERD